MTEAMSFTDEFFEYEGYRSYKYLKHLGLPWDIYSAARWCKAALNEDDGTWVKYEPNMAHKNPKVADVILFPIWIDDEVMEIYAFESEDTIFYQRSPKNNIFEFMELVYAQHNRPTTKKEKIA